MQPKPLSLVHYDVFREICEKCRTETFHFVPIGSTPDARFCEQCRIAGRIVDVSDTSVYRLVEQSDGKIVVERTM